MIADFPSDGPLAYDTPEAAYDAHARGLPSALDFDGRDILLDGEIIGSRSLLGDDERGYEVERHEYCYPEGRDLTSR